MAKKFLLFFTLVITFVLSFTTMMTGTANAAESANVKDYLNYLSADELAAIQTKIDGIRDNHQLDTVIVITNDTSGKSSMAYADDFYDYNGYGIGGNKSGLLMLVNMQDREVWISTTGAAIDIYDDNRIQAMVRDITTKLKSSQYAGACDAFLEDVKLYASVVTDDSRSIMEENASARSAGRDVPGAVRPQNNYLANVLSLLMNPLFYTLPAIATIIVVVIVTLSSKGSVSVTGRTYEQSGSFKLMGLQDDFMRESTTCVKISTDSSSGGSSGSSTHSGSSGTTHGGGGGSF